MGFAVVAHEAKMISEVERAAIRIVGAIESAGCLLLIGMLVLASVVLVSG